MQEKLNPVKSIEIINLNISNTNLNQNLNQNLNPISKKNSKTNSIKNLDNYINNNKKIENLKDKNKDIDFINKDNNKNTNQNKNKIFFDEFNFKAKEFFEMIFLFLELNKLDKNKEIIFQYEKISENFFKNLLENKNFYDHKKDNKSKGKDLLKNSSRKKKFAVKKSINNCNSCSILEYNTNNININNSSNEEFFRLKQIGVQRQKKSNPIINKYDRENLDNSDSRMNFSRIGGYSNSLAKARLEKELLKTSKNQDSTEISSINNKSNTFRNTGATNFFENNNINTNTNSNTLNNTNNNNINFNFNDNQFNIVNCLNNSISLNLNNSDSNNLKAENNYFNNYNSLNKERSVLINSYKNKNNNRNNSSFDDFINFEKIKIYKKSINYNNTPLIYSIPLIEKIQKNWRKFKIKKISNSDNINKSLNPVKNSILTKISKIQDVKNLMEMISSSLNLFNKIKMDNKEGKLLFINLLFNLIIIYSFIIFLAFDNIKDYLILNNCNDLINNSRSEKYHSEIINNFLNNKD
jgi:hypothetical protein